MNSGVSSAGGPDAPRERRAAAAVPRVLVLLDHYEPGHKAGGQLRTVANLVERLGHEYEFLIATADRDLGDAGPYPGVPTGAWVPRGRSRVIYLSPRARGVAGWYRLLRDTRCDVVYVNSVFSRNSLRVLLLRALSLVPRRPTILAPRGELSPGALGIKSRRKRLFLRLATRVGLFRGLTWQASTELERSEIAAALTAAERRSSSPSRPTSGSAGRLGSGRRSEPVVHVAIDLAGMPAPGGAARVKQPGRAALAFVSRISPKKNLDYALKVLRAVRASVDLDIFGPIEDARYWAECERAIGVLPRHVTAVYRGVLGADQVAETLARYHGLLFPTRGENYGHVIVESLGAGCPVIVSDQTPWRDLERQSVGWDLSLDDPASFVGAIEVLAAMDQSTFDSWSASATAFAGRVSQSREAIEQTRELFRAALAPGAPEPCGRM